MTTLVEKVLATDFTADGTDTFYRGTIVHFYGEGGSRGGSGGCGGSIFDTFKLDIDRNKGSSGGLIDPQPFQEGYDLGEGYQFHTHGPDKNILTFGSLEFQEKPVKSFTGFESSMIDLVLRGNFKRFP